MSDDEELLAFLAPSDTAAPLRLEPVVAAGPAERWELSAEERELLLLVLQNDATVVDGFSAGSRGQEENATATTTTTGTTGATSAMPAKRRKKKKKPRPHRRRRKHEVDELRVEAAELEEALRQLRRERRALVATALSAKPSSVWERIGRFEREEARAAIAENLRLRAQYESQLLALQRLETAYRSQFDLAAVGLPPTPNQPLSERLHCDPFDDDFAIFASLGRDFDTQFDGIDAVLAAAGLLHFDGEMAAQLRTKKDGHGRFFMERMHSRVIPEDMFVLDAAINATQKDPRVHRTHQFYEVRHATDTVSFVKTEDVIRLPHAEARLTTRMAVKRFIHTDRVAGVWDAVIDISGCVSMRLSEKGWNLLRPPRATVTSHQSGGGGNGSLSVEQSCVRYFPIDSTVRSERDVGVGTVNRILVESYERHLARMHQVTDEILRGQFSALAL